MGPLTRFTLRTCLEAQSKKLMTQLRVLIGVPTLYPELPKVLNQGICPKLDRDSTYALGYIP